MTGFLSALVIFFVVIDPVGLVPVYLGLVRGFDARSRRVIALRGAGIGLGVIVFFAYFGQIVLDRLAIGLPAFRVSGGALLFWLAFEMLFDRRTERKEKVAGEARTLEEAADIAVFPLAVPLIAGPGAITSTLLLMARYGAGVAGQAAVLGAAAIVILSLVPAFLFADLIARLLGRTVMHTVGRVLGIVLAALAAQTVLDGLTAIWPPH